jgi:methylated-DNA-[protein]-cysteine S-methyltransferase
MEMTGYLPFDTAIGRCAVAWGERGITKVWLPEARDTTPRGTPTPEVTQAVADMKALLDGELHDLRHVALDLEAVPEFHREVYAIAREIPPGATLTYGDIARRLGDVQLSRAVGAALGSNPCPIVVPCHRVVGAGGALTGFSAPGGTRTKERMLRIEGALAEPPLSLF